MNDDSRGLRSTRCPRGRTRTAPCRLFERAVHGWHLADHASELAAAPRPTSGLMCRHTRGAPTRLALGIAGGGGHAQQSHGGFVGLVGVQMQLAELGGRTKAQRQHAGGQRIQRAGVARLFGAQQPLAFCRASLLDRPSGLSSNSTPCTGRRCTLVRGAHPGVMLCMSSFFEREATACAIRRSCRRRARSCGQTRNAAWARCGYAGA
jgi:hypothetical protein